MCFFFLQRDGTFSVLHHSEEHGHDVHPKTSTSTGNNWRKEEYEEGNPKPKLEQCLAQDKSGQLMFMLIKRKCYRFTMTSVL